MRSDITRSRGVRPLAGFGAEPQGLAVGRDLCARRPFITQYFYFCKRSNKHHKMIPKSTTKPLTVHPAHPRPTVLKCTQQIPIHSNCQANPLPPVLHADYARELPSIHKPKQTKHLTVHLPHPRPTAPSAPGKSQSAPTVKRTPCHLHYIPTARRKKTKIIQSQQNV